MSHIYMTKLWMPFFCLTPTVFAQHFAPAAAAAAHPFAMDDGANSYHRIHYKYRLSLVNSGPESAMARHGTQIKRRQHVEYTLALL